MIRNINENFGDPIEFQTVEEMAAELEKLGYMPEDGLVEGRDYEVVAEPFVYFVYGANEIHFPDHDYAVRFLEEAGYTFSGETAFEVHEGFKGNIEFWTEEGKNLDFYTDGYEPRLYVGEAVDGD